MPDRITTASSKTRRRPFMTTAAAAFSLGLFITFGLGRGTPMEAPVDLASSELKLLGVGYKHSKRYRPLYLDQHSVPDNGNRTHHDMPYGGSDEIRELQRFHPETLWPPSM